MNGVANPIALQISLSILAASGIARAHRHFVAAAFDAIQREAEFDNRSNTNYLITSV